MPPYSLPYNQDGIYCGLSENEIGSGLLNVEKRLQKYLYKNNIGITLEKRLQKKQTFKAVFKTKNSAAFSPNNNNSKNKKWTR